MAIYSINFSDDGSLIQIEAEFYEIRDCFVRLYRGEVLVEEFAAYAADTVRYIVRQDEEEDD